MESFPEIQVSSISQVTDICLIGAGYVGGPSGTVFAEKWNKKLNPAISKTIKVHVVDIASARINAWNSNHLPIFEKDLKESVIRVRNINNDPDASKNLFFSTNVAQAIKDSQIIFICVNTPTKYRGTPETGCGAAADLTAVEAVARFIAQSAESNKIVVEKSTVPIHTAKMLNKILGTNAKTSKSGPYSNVQFQILSNPEFMAEGSAMHNLREPHRVLIGGGRLLFGEKASDVREIASQAAVKTLCSLYSAENSWVSQDRLCTTNVWSSELSKLVANAFLAQRISSINSISALCEKTGADITQVSDAVGRDKRIGNRYLSCSVGFGGSCLQKDVLNLSYISGAFGLPEVAEYWRQVVRMNDFQKHRFATT